MATRDVRLLHRLRIALLRVEAFLPWTRRVFSTGLAARRAIPETSVRVGIGTGRLPVQSVRSGDTRGEGIRASKIPHRQQVSHPAQ